MRQASLGKRNPALRRGSFLWRSIVPGLGSGASPCQIPSGTGFYGMFFCLRALVPLPGRHAGLAESVASLPIPQLLGGWGSPITPLSQATSGTSVGLDVGMGGWKGLRAAGWSLAHPLAGSTNHGLKGVNKTHLGRFQRVRPCEPHVQPLAAARGPVRPHGARCSIHWSAAEARISGGFAKLHQSPV